ncbi:hypothetical protein GALL_513360 [mine drainage metagenome]|uniref:Uncharacterized protein n=1 Tax=mine drainage metagenome TaxID=410659 RepID=A0A1J5P6B0_9ZZZZ
MPGKIVMAFHVATSSCFNVASSVFSLFPLRWTPSRKPGARITSSTALPAAQASGLPPYVVPWVPGTSALANCSLARTAPSGKPPPIPLAEDITSGVIPDHSCANSLPVRPMPVCTSSMPRMMPYSSHTARRSRRNCMSAGRTPPSPCTGSTMMPQVAGPIAARTAFMLLNGTWSKPSTTGPKPSR